MILRGKLTALEVSQQPGNKADVHQRYVGKLHGYDDILLSRKGNEH